MRHYCFFLLLFILSGCGDKVDDPAPEAVPVDVLEPADNGPAYQPLEAPELRMGRLTQAQYRNAVRHLLGSDITTPSSLEPDLPLDGLITAGASITTISPRGSELYEAAARSLAKQAMESEEKKLSLVPCKPTGVADESCLKAFAATFGRRVWRRTLLDSEVEQLTKVGVKAAKTLDDFYSGAEYILITMLQSPHFLYRIEVGEADPLRSGQRRLTSWEVASRLSFFLWNTTPDDTLLDAAESNLLVTDSGLETQVKRMLADERIKAGIRNFFKEWLHLDDLDDMKKDPNIFKHYSSDVGEMAREETLRLVEHLFVDGEADFREFFTTRTTFVNRRLAAIYNVPAAVLEGFGKIELPEDGQRRGFLGHVSYLGLHSHPVSSSATLRGAFLREALLCDVVPPPPAEVNTALPEPSKDAKTLRERLQVHMEEPMCSGCHRPMDIPGLGFENFDGMGMFRVTENDAVIDPSGNLDGAEFAGFRELTQVVAESPKVSRCFVRKLFSYAVGHPYDVGESGEVDRLRDKFVEAGRKLRPLLREIILSPGFRQAGEVQ